MIFLLKYWKLLLGGAIIVAAGVAIFILHMELSSAQAALSKSRAQTAVLSATVAEQNASIERYAHAEAHLATRVKATEAANAKTRTLTRTIVRTITETKIAPGCAAAMNFLRAEAPEVSKP